MRAWRSYQASSSVGITARSRNFQPRFSGIRTRHSSDCDADKPYGRPMAQKKAELPPRRRMRGFEAAAQLVASRVKAAGETRGFAVARLLTHWTEVVGPEIAAHTRPVKISHGKGIGATLTLLVPGAQARSEERRVGTECG